MSATCKYWSVEASSIETTGSLRESAYDEVRCREYATSDVAEVWSVETSDNFECLLHGNLTLVWGVGGALLGLVDGGAMASSDATV